MNKTIVILVVCFVLGPCGLWVITGATSVMEMLMRLLVCLAVFAWLSWMGYLILDNCDGGDKYEENKIIERLAKENQELRRKQNLFWNFLRTTKYYPKKKFWDEYQGIPTIDAQFKEIKNLMEKY